MASPVVSTAIDNGILTITVTGFAPIVIDPSDYPDSIREYAALHGFKQKYVDAAALGAEATPKEKYEAIRALVNHHAETGDWNRTGTGDGSGGDGLLVQALMEYHDMDRDAARAAVGTVSKAEQAALRASPELSPIIARIKIARADKAAKKAPTVDTSSLLAKLARAA